MGARRDDADAAAAAAIAPVDRASMVLVLILSIPHLRFPILDAMNIYVLKS
jgi:hypothetical protein